MRHRHAGPKVQYRTRRNRIMYRERPMHKITVKRREGRHRAYAAMLKGHREIPVAVPLEKSERRSLGEEFIERAFPDSDPSYRREWLERFEGGFPESSMDRERRQIYAEILKEREIEEP